MSKVLGFCIIIVIIFGYYINYQRELHNKREFEFNHKIDSLNYKISKLDSVHKKQDSIIYIYKDSIVYVDSLIQKQTIKYIYIKNKYNEIHNHISHYTPTELDSFFLSRYGQ